MKGWSGKEREEGRKEGRMKEKNEWISHLTEYLEGLESRWVGEEGWMNERINKWMNEWISHLTEYLGGLESRWVGEEGWMGERINK